MKSADNNIGFDSTFMENERLPQSFTVSFTEVTKDGEEHVRITIDGTQIGDVIDDNSYENDFYRYHDELNPIVVIVEGYEIGAFMPAFSKMELPVPRVTFALPSLKHRSPKKAE